MKNKKKVAIIKIMFTILAICIICGVIYYFIPLIKNLNTRDGQILFKETISNLGVRGWLLLFVIQLAQIVLVILPGEPIEVLAGACYGAWGGALFITISVLVTTTLIFFIVRKYGKKFIYNFFEKNKIDKLENKLLKNKKRLELILFLLFLIPGTPKDLVVYIGGLLPIKPLRFILLSTFIRFPSIITSTLVGSNLLAGDWKISMYIYGLVIIATGIILFAVNKQDKEKELMDVLK